jgi:carboxyl-terminal processing protease
MALASHPPSGRREVRRRPLVVLALAGLMLVAGAIPVLAADEDDDVVRPDYELIEEALGIIAGEYVDGSILTQDDLTVGALRGIVDALGDSGHTVYLTEEEMALEEEELMGRVSGIGVLIDQRAGVPLIVSVLDGSPADRAGMQAGDIIVSVDGADTLRLPFDEIADRVRGEVGTSVRIGVERPGAPNLMELDIVRSEVLVEPATWAFVPGSDVALVRIVQFSTDSGRAANDAVRGALDAGATAIVLDLRGNPGGLVHAALVAAGAFLDGGVGYREIDADGDLREVPVSADWLIAPDIPLVVLVDYGTASAAEILAAALRDNGRARIVGEQTFGAGTVLNTIELSDGSALRLAVRKWLTPAGEDVFRVGLEPDEVVALPLGTRPLDPGDLVGMSADDFRSSQDLQLLRAVELIGG